MLRRIREPPCTVFLRVPASCVRQRAACPRGHAQYPNPNPNVVRAPGGRTVRTVPHIVWHHRRYLTRPSSRSTPLSGTISALRCVTFATILDWIPGCTSALAILGTPCGALLKLTATCAATWLTRPFRTGSTATCLPFRPWRASPGRSSSCQSLCLQTWPHRARVEHEFCIGQLAPGRMLSAMA